jgi:hypothetical protein
LSLSERNLTYVYMADARDLKRRLVLEKEDWL